MLFAIWIEVRTRRLEIWCLALGVLVKVQRVLARRQILQIEADLHALLRLLERRRAHALALGVLDVEVIPGCGCEKRAYTAQHEQN